MRRWDVLDRVGRSSAQQKDPPRFRRVVARQVFYFPPPVLLNVPLSFTVS